LSRTRRESSDETAPLRAFKLAAIGEWLGAIPTGTSDRYLPRATAVVEGIEDPDTLAIELAHEVARTAQRALAAYTLQLRGSVAAAADSLYEVTWRAMPWWRKRMVSINRLNASRWLLAAGDTARATELLFGCQVANFRASQFYENLLLAGHCYLELARIEEARGRDGQARKYYWQFLKRYDSPVEAHRQLVEEARAAYERVGGT